ncbi:AAA family ATPase [Halalkalibacter akibai]|uniref:UDP-N-acetylglucosamine kinase n=1 Tax=Halalkalibacter akibai (strain ATCC 43226 / DSM 21942 / CIP 109018 / JCM 9157 / 1139) TaxID=1236973 RepID=W4QN58_HALA3|nr:AAA family ATPase [Halalkalibacter akibai]GAE33088.1 hypothetical protein JCM9157_75 [Halalkalibacter akibai JCM 9157]
MKTVVFVSAPSGAGKSTMRKVVPKVLENHFQNGIAGIEIDDIYRFLDPEFKAKHHLEVWKAARESTGHLANGLLKGNIDVVFIFGNTIFSEEQVKDVRKNIESMNVAFYHITLAPTRDTLAKRLVKRQSTVPDWLDSHLAERQPYVEANWTNVIDNSNLTPEETVQAIYELMIVGKEMRGKASTTKKWQWLHKLFKRNR